MFVSSEGFLRLPDVRLFYRSRGSGEPLVFLHGDQQAGISFEVYRLMCGDDGEFVVSGNLRDWDVVGRLGELHVPTLVVRGRYDMTSEEIVNHTAGAIRSSKQVVFARSGHFPFFEEREKFVRVVRAFLKQLQ